MLRKKYIIFAVIVVFVGIGFYFGFENFDKGNVQCSKLVSVIYMENDMKKGSESSIIFGAKELVLVDKKIKNMSGYGIVNEYKISEKNVKNVLKMVNKYSLVSLSKLDLDESKISGEIDLNRSLIIRCDDNTEIMTYNINYLMSLSKKDYKHLDKVMNYINSLKKKSNLSKSYDEEEEMKKAFNEEENS